MKKLVLITIMSMFSASAFASYTQVMFKGAWKVSSEQQAVNAAVDALHDLEQGIVSGRFFSVMDDHCADISRDVIAKSKFKRKMTYGGGQVRNASISVGKSYDGRGNAAYTSTVKASVPCIRKSNSRDDD